eukprot:CAMPEP_0117588638 /NCGR_PEP_ID=MMETSP0784-20121206/69961_1 /TAXON_ID=39447 /ORGANISM="" /LENGTH=62 /DNA_ID=CAMNT_0005390017 /DNA_START=72 /DNA_END=257 /DNA_ORIENTATION=+
MVCGSAVLVRAVIFVGHVVAPGHGIPSMPCDSVTLLVGPGATGAQVDFCEDEDAPVRLLQTY